MSDFRVAEEQIYVNETFQGRAPGRIIARSSEHRALADDRLEISQSLDWLGPVEWDAPDGRTIATEQRTYLLRPGDVAHVIDLRSELRPTQWEFEIGPTRHAFFAVRLSEDLHVAHGGRWTAAEGGQGAAAILGRGSAWVNCSGSVAAGRRAGVAVFPYPSTSGSPWAGVGPPLSGLKPASNANAH